MQVVNARRELGKTANLMATTISKLRQMMQGAMEVRPGVELIKYVIDLTAHGPE